MPGHVSDSAVASATNNLVEQPMSTLLQLGAAGADVSADEAGAALEADAAVSLVVSLFLSAPPFLPRPRPPRLGRSVGVWDWAGAWVSAPTFSFSGADCEAGVAFLVSFRSRIWIFPCATVIGLPAIALTRDSWSEKST